MRKRRAFNICKGEIVNDWLKCASKASSPASFVVLVELSAVDFGVFEKGVSPSGRLVQLACTSELARLGGGPWLP